MTGSTKVKSPPATADAPEKTILILDYDGTLHDSMSIYEPAFRTAISELEDKGWLEHRDYSAAEIRHWIGFSAGDMWRSFQPGFTASQRETGSSRIGTLMTAAIREGRARLYPGTEETLELLAASYELWFLSNCKISYMEAHRQMFGLDQWFRRYLCTEAYGYAAKEEILRQTNDELRTDAWMNGPVTLCGKRVEPGDLMLADDSGVCICPPEIAASVLEECLKIAAAEERMRELIESNAPISELRPLFRSRYK